MLWWRTIWTSYTNYSLIIYSLKIQYFPIFQYFQNYPKQLFFLSNTLKNHSKILKHLLYQGHQPDEAIFRLNEILARYLRSGTAMYGKQGAHLPIPPP